MNNKDIRDAASKSGVRLWQIADRLGMTDSYFSRKLRKEFSTGEKRTIIKIIAEIEKEDKHAETTRKE